MKVLVIFDKGDCRLRCMVDPAVLLYRDWLTALLKDVSQPKASQCCTSLGIQTKPLAHRPSQPIEKLAQITTGDRTFKRRLTAPVVATMLAARSNTVTSQPAFRRATAVETPPTLPPMMITFVGILWLLQARQFNAAL